MRRSLKVSFTPDPDDAFAWWALATGLVHVAGHGLDFEPRHLSGSNAGCLRGELDIAAVSAAAYPYIHRQYQILPSGASVGRGYGPALVALQGTPEGEIAGGTVAVPATMTTGALLFRLFFPNAATVELPFEEIAEAVAARRVSAGVLIHEELLNWVHLGLERRLCLGAEWSRRTGLPLPVGVVVARRSLGHAVVGEIGRRLRESVEMARSHKDMALPWAMGFSREASQGIADQFIEMFTNEDTVELPPDAREALELLLLRGAERGLTPAAPRPDIAWPRVAVGSFPAPQ